MPREEEKLQRPYSAGTASDSTARSGFANNTAGPKESPRKPKTQEPSAPQESPKKAKATPAEEQPKPREVPKLTHALAVECEAVAAGASAKLDKFKGLQNEVEQDEKKTNHVEGYAYNHCVTEMTALQKKFSASLKTMRASTAMY